MVYFGVFSPFNHSLYFTRLETNIMFSFEGLVVLLHQTEVGSCIQVKLFAQYIDHLDLVNLGFICLPENGTSKQMALVSQLRPSVLPLQCDGAVCWTGLGL